MQQPANLSPGNSPRLQSIDALRGFDMFWIMRGDGLAKTLGVFFGLPILVTQMEHVEWEGFHFYDLIFPLFLFIVGVVLPFSLSKYTSLDGPRENLSHAYIRIFRRTVLLIFLGWVYNGFLQLNFEKFRWVGVLQRIGICYFFAALAVLHLRVRGQAALFLAIIGGYWALLRYVPAPGFAAFDLSKEGNLAGYIDRLLLPGRLYYGHGDNEGLLSTIPAIGTTLLGVLAGHWLRSERSSFVKFLGLVLAAAACLAAGYAWSQTFPIIKILWTSSYVLVVGGWSLALLALFYLIIDVLGLRRWAFFFVVIGVNPITIYMMQRAIDFKYTTEFFVGGIMKHAGSADKVVFAVAEVAVRWLVLLYLYRNKTFLRV